MKNQILILTLLAFIALAITPASATITITPVNVTSSSIMWSWSPVTVQNLSIDGVFVCNINPASTNFILSGLGPNEPHTINIITAGDSGSNTTTTAGDTNTNQSTGLLTFLNTWGYLILIIVMFIAGSKVHWIFYWFGSIVSLYALALFIQQYPSITTDIWHVEFYIYLCTFLMGIVFWVLRIWKKHW